MSLIVFPAIDLKQGQVVRLAEGERHFHAGDVSLRPAGAAA